MIHDFTGKMCSVIATAALACMLLQLLLVLGTWLTDHEHRRAKSWLRVVGAGSLAPFSFVLTFPTYTASTFGTAEQAGYLSELESFAPGVNVRPATWH